MQIEYTEKELALALADHLEKKLDNEQLLNFCSSFSNFIDQELGEMLIQEINKNCLHK